MELRFVLQWRRDLLLIVYCSKKKKKIVILQTTTDCSLTKFIAESFITQNN